MVTSNCRAFGLRKFIYQEKMQPTGDIPRVFFTLKPHVISRSHAFVSWLWVQTPSYTHLYHTFPTSPPQKKYHTCVFVVMSQQLTRLGWRAKSEIFRGQSCSVSCVPPLEGTSQYFCNQEGVFEGDPCDVFGGCFWWRYFSSWNFHQRRNQRNKKTQDIFFKVTFRKLHGWKVGDRLCLDVLICGCCCVGTGAF